MVQYTFQVEESHQSLPSLPNLKWFNGMVNFYSHFAQHTALTMLLLSATMASEKGKELVNKYEAAKCTFVDTKAAFA